MSSIPALDREDPAALEAQLRAARRAGDHDTELQCLELLLPHIGVKPIAQAAKDRLNAACETKDPDIAAEAANITRILTPVHWKIEFELARINLIFDPQVCYFSALRLWSNDWHLFMKLNGWEYIYHKDTLKGRWAKITGPPTASKRFPRVPKQHKRRQ